MHCSSYFEANKTLFVSGASRGIGLAIAKRAAQDGANIILAAKTSDRSVQNRFCAGSTRLGCEALGRDGSWVGFTMDEFSHG